MKRRINEQNWLKKRSLVEQDDLPPLGGYPDMGPPTQPGVPDNPQAGMAGDDPTQMAVDDQPGEEDLSGDPAFPEMPESKENDDFEIWKIKYVKESIKGDPNVLIQRILNVRDRELDAPQRKFVEDNLDINFLRQNANVLQISNEIRKDLKKDFDRTNPATSVVRHICDNLEKSPLLNEVYIKLLGLGGGKMDQHRKYVASLLGAVQVGVGGQTEDLVFEEVDYSIRISTRFNARWGDVNIGRWYSKEDDPERYLRPAELDRMEGGSPEEKDVLRRRVVIESIAEMFRERAFIINVVGQDGTIYHLAWDLGNSLKSAFLDGKLVVRSSDNDTKEAFIDPDGSLISVPNMSIFYVKESGDIDQRGKPGIEEIEFIAHRDGMLYLTAQLDLIKEAATSLDGILFRETLWQGNPADVLKTMRCVPSSPEMLLRQC